MIKFVSMLFAILVVSGCSGQLEQAPPVAGTASAVMKEVYKIGAGDNLSVSVWKNPELSGSVPVRPDGKISVPLIGDIQAEGMEPQALASAITSKLENYVRSPQVTVVVTNAVSTEFLHRVRVTGAIQKPASLPFQKGMTVMDVVLVSGGLTPFASANDARLYRNTEEGPKVYGIKLKDILEKGKIETNYPLQPGDIVTIPEKLF